MRKILTVSAGLLLGVLSWGQVATIPAAGTTNPSKPAASAHVAEPTIKKAKHHRRRSRHHRRHHKTAA
jgi:hypothetical protein